MYIFICIYVTHLCPPSSQPPTPMIIVIYKNNTSTTDTDLNQRFQTTLTFLQNIPSKMKGKKWLTVRREKGRPSSREEEQDNRGKKRGSRGRGGRFGVKT